MGNDEAQPVVSIRKNPAPAELKPQWQKVNVALKNVIARKSHYACLFKDISDYEHKALKVLSHLIKANQNHRGNINKQYVAVDSVLRSNDFKFVMENIAHISSDIANKIDWQVRYALWFLRDAAEQTCDELFKVVVNDAECLFKKYEPTLAGRIAEEEPISYAPKIR